MIWRHPVASRRRIPFFCLRPSLTPVQTSLVDAVPAPSSPTTDQQRVSSHVIYETCDRLAGLICSEMFWSEVTKGQTFEGAAPSPFPYLQTERKNSAARCWDARAFTDTPGLSGSGSEVPTGTSPRLKEIYFSIFLLLSNATNLASDVSAQ